MKLLLALAVGVACAGIASTRAGCLPGGEPEGDGGPGARETLILDPRAADAAAIDELHDAGKDAICRVPVSPLDLLQLCRDKGFDAVTFDAETSELLDRANRLKLPVVGSAGRKTTTGS